jgi:hypothetical protein
VRQSPDPAQAVLSFLESTYSAAADSAKWDAPIWIVTTQSPMPPFISHDWRHSALGKMIRV